jgi:hypothetical protein
MQRLLLAIKGMTSARMIPQLEVAANRVIDVGGVYLNPGKSGTSKQKAAMYKLKVIGFDNQRPRVRRRENKIRVPAFQYTDVTAYGEDDTPWKDEYIPTDKIKYEARRIKSNRGRSFDCSPTA